jgi:hypothetical protein
MPVARVLLAAITRYEVGLVGPKNGVNLVYTLPEYFEDVSIRFYRNGVRQNRGIGDDFVVSESGGPGTGFDTITVLNDAPLLEETLFADYIVT